MNNRFFVRRLSTFVCFFILFTSGLLSGCAEVSLVSEATKFINSPPWGNSSGTYKKANKLYGHYKVGKPYQIKRKWYYPKIDYQYKETGVASWYGPQFHGKRTANGAIFDMNLVTAAHKTLPLPSYVEVKNLDNGKVLKILVNDRGPYVGDRIIDLSRRAAELLGFKKQGTALVEVHILADESALLAANLQQNTLNQFADNGKLPKAAPTTHVESQELALLEGSKAATASDAVLNNADINDADINDDDDNEANNLSSPTILAQNSNGDDANNLGDDGAEKWQFDVEKLDETLRIEPVKQRPRIYIQAGAFGQYANAVKARARLSVFAPVNISQYDNGDTPLFRVRLGPIGTVRDADNILQNVASNGYPDARIIVVE